MRRVIETARSVDVRLTATAFTSDRTHFEAECSFIWVPDDMRSDSDFNLPLLGRVTVGFFQYDSNGVAVLMASLFGRWLYLHSWGVWY